MPTPIQIRQVEQHELGLDQNGCALLSAVRCAPHLDPIIHSARCCSKCWSICFPSFRFERQSGFGCGFAGHGWVDERSENLSAAAWTRPVRKLLGQRIPAEVFYWGFEAEIKQVRTAGYTTTAKSVPSDSAGTAVGRIYPFLLAGKDELLWPGAQE